MHELTIVIPTYNESARIRENIAILREQLDRDCVDATILLVDDGSYGEANWTALCELTDTHPNVECIRLSRNFGKETAILAGLSEVRTPLCLVMDADMQHPPRYIRPMLDRMRETDVDLVEGVKTSRGKEGMGYKAVSLFSYWVFYKVCRIDIRGSSDFKLFNRKVIDALLKFQETTIFFRGLVGWSGFRRIEFPFDVEDREEGTSRFSIYKRLRFVLLALLAHSGKPLYIVFIFSLFFILLALIMSVMALYNYMTGQAVDGFTTVILMLSIFGGITLFSLGIIGLYLSRIYDEVKRRPQYLISDRAGKDSLYSDHH